MYSLQEYYDSKEVQFLSGNNRNYVMYDLILQISIVPRSKYRLGHYQYYKPERDLQTNVQVKKSE